MNISDNFNRASLGTDWTNVNGTASINGSTVWDAQSGFAHSAFTGAAWSGSPTDYYVEAKAVGLATSSDMGVCARHASGARTAYIWVINENDAAVTLGSSMQCQLFRVVNGAGGGDYIALGSPVAVTVNANDLVRIQVTGTGATVTIKGYVAGVEKQSFDDTSGSRITAAGFPALYGNAVGDQWDDFAASDLGPAAPTNYPRTPDGAELLRPFNMGSMRRRSPRRRSTIFLKAA